jgi:hypothetical protein
VIQGLYHNWGKDVNSFAALMDEGAKEAIADMRLKLTATLIDNLKAGEQERPVSAPAPQPSAQATQPIQPEPQAHSVPQAQPEQPAIPAPSVQAASPAQPAVENSTETTPIPAPPDTVGK